MERTCNGQGTDIYVYKVGFYGYLLTFRDDILNEKEILHVKVYDPLKL